MSSISERRATAVLAFAVALFSIYLLWLTLSFPPGEGAPGPAVWPRVVLTMTLLASVYLAAASLFGRGAEEKKIVTRHLVLPGIVMALTVAYLFAMQWAFYASTSVFLFVCMSILRVRSWPIRIGVSLGVPLVVYLTFVQVLHLTFPSLLNVLGVS